MNTIPMPQHASPIDYAWPYVIRDLLTTLEANGFKFAEVNNGEERTHQPTLEKALEEICAVDESNLYVRKGKESSLWMSIILGNEPCETISDYALRETVVGKELDKLITDWSNKWEGIRCPTWHEAQFWLEVMK